MLGFGYQFANSSFEAGVCRLKLSICGTDTKKNMVTRPLIMDVWVLNPDLKLKTKKAPLKGRLFVYPGSVSYYLGLTTTFAAPTRSPPPFTSSTMYTPFFAVDPRSMSMLV